MYRTLTVVLACLGMAGALAIDTYLPSMPAIGREFGVGPVAVRLRAVEEALAAGEPGSIAAHKSLDDCDPAARSELGLA